MPGAPRCPICRAWKAPYEEQYHNLLRRSIGKDYTYVEYNDSRTGEPYTCLLYTSR